MRLFLILPGLALFASVPAAAQAGPNRDASGRAILLRPLQLLKLDDMDFGWLTVSGAGTAVLDPVTGAVTTTGGVLAAGGDPLPAAFVGAASRASPVIIRIPKNPITLTRDGGTETMTLTAWTLDGPGTRHVAANNGFLFKVGGTLNVAANQADGHYTGTFTVEVQYP